MQPPGEKALQQMFFFFGVLQIFSVQPIRALLVENFLSELFRKTLLSSL